MRLYELTNAFLQVASLIEDSDDQELILSTLDSLELEIEDKAENIVKLWRSLKARADAVKAEEYRLAERRKRLEKQAEGLLAYLESQMKLLNRDKFEFDTFTVKLQLNPPSVDVVDPDKLPAKYWRIPKPEPDKQLIKQDLANGIDVPGADLRQERKIRVR